MTTAQAPHPSEEAGRKIVHASCETCHSLKAGEVKVGPSLSGVLNGSVPRLSADSAREVIRKGRKKMPAYGSVFSPADIDSVVQYLKEMPQ